MTLSLPTPASPFNIGTRGSPLALAQAHETRSRLMAAFDLPQEAFAICVIKVMGDAIQDRPLKEIGGKGLFTREIEEALLDGSIDIAVHSMKDMPVDQPGGLLLNTYLPREDVRDAFVSLNAKGLNDLAQGATVGTSSLRRRSQLLAKRPDLNIVEFRGNVQTRLKKLGDGVAEATFLAMAGLNRLGMNDVPRTAVAAEDMLPAVAQGAIGIERRGDDSRAAEMLAAIGALAELDGGNLRLRGEILRTDGTVVYNDDVTGLIEDGAEIGRAMAAKLLSQAGPDFFDH
jgi:hydroxymethylbilane synthase